MYTSFPKEYVTLRFYCMCIYMYVYSMSYVCVCVCVCVCRVLSLSGEEVEDVSIDALVTTDQTFYAANVTGGNIVQVQYARTNYYHSKTLPVLHFDGILVKHSMYVMLVVILACHVVKGELCYMSGHI